MTTATLAAPTQTILHPHLSVTIAGRPTDVLSFDAQHGTDQPIGTASVTLPLPLPGHLRGADGNVLNQRIEIKAGYEETVIRTVFSGRIDADDMEISEQEQTATLRARGWATLLDWDEETDLVFSGPIPLHDIVRSLCRWRGVPSYRVDPILGPSGAVLQLGGNVRVDDGNVIIPRRTSPLAWITRTVELFGYRLFDTPSGELRVQRVSGTPRTDPDVSYTEGLNAFRLGRSRDLKPMVTYWRVEGPTYTDADGVQVPIVSIPETVPYNPLLNPPGYRAGRASDNVLVTPGLATAVRATREIDYAAPYREVSWEALADPWLQPGDTAHVTSPTMDLSGRFWITSIRQRAEPDTGYASSFTGWAGGGSRLPAGDDATFLTVQAGARHVGDEYLPHYTVPAPGGTTITIPFTVPDEYVSIAISGRHHGTNSFLIDGASSESNVSKVLVFQNGEEVGSAEMPVSPENLLQRLDYRHDRHWETFRMPVPGKLEPGSAELRFVSGVDSQGGQDDFEIKNVVLELRGVGQTVLPRPRGF